jgi:uncharacterized protein (DUF433 family)
MNELLLLERITLNPKIMAGKPVIKGTRLTVDFILNLFAHGATTAEILEEYAGLTAEDVQALLPFRDKIVTRHRLHAFDNGGGMKCAFSLMNAQGQE